MLLLVKTEDIDSFCQDFVEAQHSCFQEDYQEGALKAYHTNHHHHLEEYNLSGTIVLYKLVPFLGCF